MSHRESVLHKGVLVKCPENPRYFMHSGGEPVLLTGSHNWSVFQDLLCPGESPFDFDEFVEMLVARGHNCTRGWLWNHPLWTPWTEDVVQITPLPWQRTGPGLAQDGGKKFDLGKWNEEFFDRLRRRVIALGEKGIYTSVMFFDGWCLKNPTAAADAWVTHPFNRANNINGVDGDLDGDGKPEIYSLSVPDALKYQKAFVAKVIDTLGDLDHVMWEIVNEVEASEAAYAWHVHMIDFVRSYEADRPKQHPVGMTASGQIKDLELDNLRLRSSRADWISPGRGADSVYCNDPPAADGEYVVLLDTDHLYAISGYAGYVSWAWRSFTRGMNLWFMDPWRPLAGNLRFPGWAAANRRDHPAYEPLRQALGAIRRISGRIDLRRAVPAGELASTRYCLADVGRSYIVFSPRSFRAVGVDLSGLAGTAVAEWSDPVTGEVLGTLHVSGGGHVELEVPGGGEAVLFIHRLRQ